MNSSCWDITRIVRGGTGGEPAPRSPGRSGAEPGNAAPGGAPAAPAAGLPPPGAARRGLPAALRLLGAGPHRQVRAARAERRARRHPRLHPHPLHHRHPPGPPGPPRLPRPARARHALAGRQQDCDGGDGGLLRPPQPALPGPEQQPPGRRPPRRLRRGQQLLVGAEPEPRAPQRLGPPAPGSRHRPGRLPQPLQAGAGQQRHRLPAPGPVLWPRRPAAPGPEEQLAGGHQERHLRRPGPGAPGPDCQCPQDPAGRGAGGAGPAAAAPALPAGQPVRVQLRHRGPGGLAEPQPPGSRRRAADLCLPPGSPEHLAAGAGRGPAGLPLQPARRACPADLLRPAGRGAGPPRRGLPLRALPQPPRPQGLGERHAGRLPQPARGAPLSLRDARRVPCRPGLRPGHVSLGISAGRRWGPRPPGQALPVSCSGSQTPRSLWHMLPVPTGPSSQPSTSPGGPWLGQPRGSLLTQLYPGKGGKDDPAGAGCPAQRKARGSFVHSRDVQDGPGA